MTPLRILVADDDPDTVLSWSALFKVWGYECATALDGFAALATAAAFRPDVILLDLGLPRLDGFEVVRQLRQRPEGVGVLVWVVTGFGQKAIRVRAREAGADLFLVKPVDPPFLAGLLEHTAEMSRLAREVVAGTREQSKETGALTLSVRLDTVRPHVPDEQETSPPPFRRNLGPSVPATS